jgi:hypothetical protein
LDEYQTLANARNKYVHARWMIEEVLCPGKAILLRRVNPKWSEQVELVDDQMLANFVFQIVELGDKFMGLVNKDFIRRF